MRWTIAAMAVMLAGTGAASAQYVPGAIAALTEQDSGSVVRIGRGVVFSVRLPQSAGTNYAWRMIRSRDAQLAARPRIEAQTVPRGYVGGPQVVSFTVRVTGAGQFPIVFRLAPNIAQDDVGPMRTVTFLVDTGEY